MRKEKSGKPNLYLVPMSIRPIDLLRVSIYAAGQNYSDLINTRLKLAALGRELEQKEDHLHLLKDHHDYCYHVDEAIKLENKSLNKGINEWIEFNQSHNQNGAAQSSERGHMDQHHDVCLLTLAREWAFCSKLQKATPSAAILAHLNSLEQLIQKRRKRITMLKNYAQNPERMHKVPSDDFAEHELQTLVENARCTSLNDMRPGPLLLAMLVNPKTPFH